MPSTKALSGTDRAELEEAWQRDKRVPSLESRRAWAEARNVDPEAVHLWFFRRRWKAVNKKGEKVGTGTYDLPVGAAPKRKSRAAPEPPKVTRSSVRVKRERASSPDLSSLPTRPAKKVKIESTEPTLSAPRSTRHTRAHDAQPHPDCHVCFPPKTTPAPTAKPAKPPRSSGVIRHTRAHDVAPVSGCLVCFPQDGPAYTQVASSDASPAPRATKSARSARPSAQRTLTLVPAVMDCDESMTPLSSEDEGPPTTHVESEPNPNACTFSSLSEIMKKARSGALASRLPTAILAKKSAYTQVSAAELTSRSRLKTRSHAVRVHAPPAGPSAFVDVCTSSGMPSGSIPPVAAVIEPAYTQSAWCADSVRASSPALPPRFKRKFAKTEPTECLLPPSSDACSPYEASSSCATLVDETSLVTSPATSAASGSAVFNDTEPPVLSSLHGHVGTVGLRSAVESTSCDGNSEFLDPKLASHSSPVAASGVSVFSSVVSAARGWDLSLETSGSSDHRAFNRPKPEASSGVSLKAHIKDGSRNIYSAKTYSVNEPDASPRNDILSSRVNTEQRNGQVPLSRRSLMDDILSNKVAHNSPVADCGSKVISAWLSAEGDDGFAGDEPEHCRAQQPHGCNFSSSAPVVQQPTFDPTAIPPPTNPSLYACSDPACRPTTFASLSQASRFTLQPASWTRLVGPGVPGPSGWPHSSAPSAVQPKAPAVPATMSQPNAVLQAVSAQDIPTTPSKADAGPQDIPPPHRPQGAPPSRPSSPEPRRPPRPIRPGADRDHPQPSVVGAVGDVSGETVCQSAVDGSGRMQINAEGVVGGPAAHDVSIAVSNTEIIAAEVISPTALFEKTVEEPRPDVVSDPIKIEYSGIAPLPSSSPGPSTAATPAKTLRLSYSSDDEPLIVAVKRKGKASSSGVPGTLASKKTGKDKDSAPSGTEGPAADSNAEPPIKAESAAPRGRSGGRSTKGKKAVSEKTKRDAKDGAVASESNDAGGGSKAKSGGRNTKSKKGASGNAKGDLGESNNAGGESKAKPKRPRKPRKKAQPKTAEEDPKPFSFEEEWQSLFDGPPSLFPGPFPSPPCGASSPAGTDASHQRGASGSSSSDPVLMHPPRQFAYDPASLIAYQGCQWDTEGFVGMELSALPWLASMRGDTSASEQVEAQVDLTMDMPSSDDSFLNFGLPADDPTWGSYLQLLPQQPVELWMPLEVEVETDGAAEGNSCASDVAKQ